MIAARIVFDRFPELSAQAIKQVEQATKKAAFDILATGQANTPVDTGALKNSERADQVALMQWEVSANTEYARWVHDGTRHVVGRPFLLQAVEQHRDAYVQAMREILG